MTTEILRHFSSRKGLDSSGFYPQNSAKALDEGLINFLVVTDGNKVQHIQTKVFLSVRLGVVSV